MLDAPVSGGGRRREHGTLTFMVGGARGTRARLPILHAMGKNIFLAGGPGAGQAAKICNNMMLSINMVGVAGIPPGAKARPGLETSCTHRQHRHRIPGRCPITVQRLAPCRRPRPRDYAPGFMAALDA